MANYTKLNTRILLKYDTYANWSTKNPVLLAGEVAIATIASGTTQEVGSVTPPQVLIKVGDGTSTYNALNFISAKAADVHAWAKLSLTDIETLLSTGTVGEGDNKIELEDSFVQSTAFGNLSDIVEGIQEYLTKLEATSYTGSAKQTITEVKWNETDGKFDITASDIEYPVVNKTVDATDEVNAPTHKNVADAIDAAVNGINTGLGNLDLGKVGGNTGEYIAWVKQEDGQVTAGTGILPTVSEQTGETAAGVSTFVASVSQTNGRISYTMGTLPTAGTSKEGIVILGNAGGAATYERVEGLATEVGNIQTKIANAMHFIGITTTVINDGDKTKVLDGIDAAKIVDGAVILAPVADGTRYEYIWVNEEQGWEQLGQEGSFAVKGSIVNADIAANAAIAQTKVAGQLAGNNTLADDIADLSGDLSNLSTVVGNHRAFGTINGVTADDASDALTVNGDSWINISMSKEADNVDTLAITHKDVAATKTDLADFTLSATNPTVTVMGLVESDAKGHVTKAQKQEITLDLSSVNTAIGNIHSYDKVKVGNTTLAAGAANKQLEIAADIDIVLAAAGSGDTSKVTIKHKEYAAPTAAPQAEATLADGGNFTAMVGVTASNGHITEYKTQKITLPSYSTAIGNLEDAVAKTWQTNSLITKTSAEAAVEATASDIHIAGTKIDYIIWDCGGADI